VEDAEVKPWERQRDENGELEPNRWFDRFTAYRLLGASRTLLGCVNEERAIKGHKKSSYTPGSWRKAFEVWNWATRAEAWDKHLRQEAEAQWEERRKEIKEREWEQAEKLIERAEKMLGYPLSEVIQTDQEGRQVIVKPVRWSQRDVTRFLETASKLARMAAGMGEAAQALNIDVSKLTMEQLERISRGEDPIAVLATTGGRGAGDEAAPAES